MNKRMRVGIVGCGAIGGSLAEFVVKTFSREAALAGLFDTQPVKAQALARKLRVPAKVVCPTLESLISRSDIVIEAASAKVSAGIVRKALAAGKDIMVMSVGGLIKEYNALSRLAAKHNARLIIPSGAICGIDGLKAMALSGIKSVTLTTTKNPRGFLGNAYLSGRRIDPAKIKKDTVLFDGSASQAIRYFPQNINVAAVLSLAGIGPQKTRVRLIASPKTNKNIHEIRIDSVAGRIVTRTENVVHPGNPKTSYLAVLAAAAELRQQFLATEVDS